MELLVLLVLSYLLGSVPFGYLIAKWKHVDIKRVGSGNIGTTNVWRALGWKWGVLTFVGDAAKGFLAVTLVNILFTSPAVGLYIIAGSLAILGHFKPIWLNWQGGKVVATSLGVMLALLPFWFIIIVLGVFGLILLLSKQVSVGSMSAAFAAVIAKITLGGGFNQQNFEVTLFIIGIAIVIVFAHRENIKRIWRGQEGKII